MQSAASVLIPLQHQQHDRVATTAFSGPASPHLPLDDARRPVHLHAPLLHDVYRLLDLLMQLVMYRCIPAAGRA
eukprot:scaffold99727_cov48-Phaeocystis_antarctica.AAC.1